MSLHLLRQCTSKAPTDSGSSNAAYTRWEAFSPIGISHSPIPINFSQINNQFEQAKINYLSHPSTAHLNINQ